MELPPPFGPDLKVLVMAGSDPVPERHAGDPRGSPVRDKAFVRLAGRPIVEYADGSVIAKASG